MRSSKYTDLKVGVTVLLGLSILLFGIAWAKGWSIGERHPLYARFASAGGAERGDPVFIRGIKRGAVSSVEVNEQGEIIMAIDLDKKIPLYKDASASIMMLELMGGKKIEILPGTLGTFDVDHDTISGVNSGDMSTLVSMVNSLSGNIRTIAAHADSLIVSLNSIVGDPKFKEGIMSGIAEARVTLHDVSGAMTDVRTMLAENRETLRNAIKQAGDLATNLNATITELKPEAKATLEAAHVFISDATKTIRKADMTISEINRILDESRTNKSLLYKLTTDKAFSDKVDSMLTSGAKLINQLRYQGLDANIRFFNSTDPNK